MPKALFYTGTAFCLFLALTSAAEAGRELRHGVLAFAGMPDGPYAMWAIVAALLSGLAIAGLFLRMAALLAARNLFAAFVALLSVTAATAALAGVLFLQWRMTAAASHRGSARRLPGRARPGAREPGRPARTSLLRGSAIIAAP